MTTKIKPFSTTGKSLPPVDGEKKTILKLDEALKVTSSPGLSADLKTVLGPDCLVV